MDRDDIVRVSISKKKKKGKDSERKQENDRVCISRRVTVQ